jgi:lipid-binding SYLF domain-containing protein
MTHIPRLILVVPFVLLGTNPVSADEAKKAENAEQAEKAQKADEADIHQQVQETKQLWQSKDDSFDAALSKAYAYAIFPQVGKGGFIVGASHGDGEVYEKGTLIGHAKMTQTTIGAQVGGQTYAEVILFKNKKALDRFKASRFEGSMATTAIGGKKGAAAASKYKDGVAIMVLPLKGAMAEAAVGGQKFKFEPLSK